MIVPPTLDQQAMACFYYMDPLVALSKLVSGTVV